MATTLRDRGIGEPTATVAARVGIAIFSAAFAAWLADGETRELGELLDEGLAEFSALR